MNHYKVIIIGGGAGGLFLSHLLPSSLLIEKNSSCGLKLLITGNGKCNVTHYGEPDEICTHYYDRKHFVMSAIYAFAPDKIRTHFSSLGVETYIRDDGKVFPVSEKSSDIRDALLRGKQNILYNTTALSVEKNDNIFVVKTNNEEYSSNFLVLATGGITYPQTGSTGDGYTLAKSMGHTIVSPEPSLSPLKLDVETSQIEGVSVNNVTLKADKKTYTGDIVFTHNGISGPAVQNISHWVKKGSKLKISFVSDFDSRSLKNERGKTNTINALSRLLSLPHSLLSFLLKPIEQKTIATLTKIDLKFIEETLTSLTLTITGKNSNGAFVTKGGVDTNEVNSRTMESKKISNLFFLGEILDVDGECGGYNLTFAFASAYTAFSTINNRIG